MASSQSTLNIPYEKQADDASTRKCGAAALVMVYRSLGQNASQQDIWSRVARPDAAGVVKARTFLLGADARKRGLATLLIKARKPLDVLQLGLRHSLRLVLNHRAYMDSPAGHYSVLLVSRGRSPSCTTRPWARIGRCCWRIC